MGKHETDELEDRAPVAHETHDVSVAISDPVLTSERVRDSDSENAQTSDPAKWQPPKEVVWLLPLPAMQARDLLAATLLVESDLCH